MCGDVYVWCMGCNVYICRAVCVFSLNVSVVKIVCEVIEGVRVRKSLLQPTACLLRSGDYGVSFTNIESTLDPADRNPVLSIFFYTSPKNKNFVRKSFRIISIVTQIYIWILFYNVHTRATHTHARTHVHTHTVGLPTCHPESDVHNQQ